MVGPISIMPGRALVIKKNYNYGSEDTLFEVKNEFNEIDDNRREIILSGKFYPIESYELIEFNKFLVWFFVLRFSCYDFESLSKSSVQLKFFLHSKFSGRIESVELSR